MFEKLYLKEQDNVEKTIYNRLYEEHKSLLKKYDKLNRRTHLILRQGDREFLKRLKTSAKHKRSNKRMSMIIKHSDNQGTKTLSEKTSLELKLEEELIKEKELIKEIENTQKEVVYTMGAIGESRSKETGNHVKRVAEYSKLFAIYYGLCEEEAELLKQASPMHDIGKVGIADSILNKPAKLTYEEFEKMKEHSAIGYDMLKHSNRPLMKTASIVAHEHHEKFDGSGYPNGLKGYDIHIYARITAVADVFDALGSSRVYKEAWCDEDIFKLFKDERDKHFDPKLIDIFFENLEQFLNIRERFKDIN
ncbi:MAG: HD domain-containing protein [Helicobacteraceae bacterium]|nr:HD domain-containing protein [Helicobacteraceae bacterium]